ncbi:hypothetical protein CAPTEDRAFT_196745 [Capitella teleta]|uniref:Uncharacterized protein n=1 Tax=Capitella teleta TaxID=283909 RepID=R7TYC7_CAPTE|nr:hypothetical protein CAPTEDRAFT_196745 [Capitella teleta]|eukprot:ELT96426.1 hypothetical protein CAPTEDRAFT_196745 [Capitella teleta]
MRPEERGEKLREERELREVKEEQREEEKELREVKEEQREEEKELREVKEEQREEEKELREVKEEQREEEKELREVKEEQREEEKELREVKKEQREEEKELREVKKEQREEEKDLREVKEEIRTNPPIDYAPWTHLLVDSWDDGYAGYVECESQFDDLLSLFTYSTNTEFVKSTGRSLSTSLYDYSSKSLGIRWQSASQKSLGPDIPFFGRPYTILQRSTMECHHGPLHNRNTKSNARSLIFSKAENFFCKSSLPCKIDG